MSLKVDDIPVGTKSIMVGLVPSEESGMVELINDDDKAVVAKITNKDTQKFRIEVTDANDAVSVKEWNLDKLTLNPWKESLVEYQATDSSQSIGPDQTVADAQADIAFDAQDGALTGTVYKLNNIYRMFIDIKGPATAKVLKAGFYNTETKQLMGSAVTSNIGQFNTFGAMFMNAADKPKCTFRMELKDANDVVTYKDYDISGLILLDE